MTCITLPVGALETNCYLVSDANGQTAVIDPGAEPERILRTAAAHSMTIKTILLTHGHYDHIAAVNEIRRQTGAELMIHQLDAELLSDNRKNLALLFTGAIPPVDAPDRLLIDGDTVAVGALSFEVLHTPGHSKGSVCYLCKEGREETLFCGDTLFYLSCGRTDCYGGDDRIIVASLSRLAGLPYDGTAYCGHGPETTLAFERINNPYMNLMR